MQAIIERVTAKLANTGWGQGTKITPAHLNSHS
jgi:hypothetical protein